MEQQNVRKSSPLLIAVAWLIVVAPAAWGLTHTVQNAMKIFAQPAAKAPVATAPATPAATAPH